MKNQKELNHGLFLDQNQSPSQFLERRLVTLFEIKSKAIKALVLVWKELCVELGSRCDIEKLLYLKCLIIMLQG